MPGETPADRLLKEQGGEILPAEFGGRALPVEPPAAGAAPREINVPDAKKVEGNAAPTPPPETAEQIAWKQALADRINVELNIYHSCFQSVRNMVNALLSTMPQDSADIGEGQWTGGKRTPLENAEPEIALEVYRQVKAELKAGNPAAPKDALSVIGEGLNAALVALARGQK